MGEIIIHKLIILEALSAHPNSHFSSLTYLVILPFLKLLQTCLPIFDVDVLVLSIPAHTVECPIFIGNSNQF